MIAMVITYNDNDDGSSDDCDDDAYRCLVVRSLFVDKYIIYNGDIAWTHIFSN